MKTLKWIITVAAIVVLAVMAVNETLADDSADGQYLYIVQTELQRGAEGLFEVDSYRKLLPSVCEEYAQADVLLAEEFSVTDKKGNCVAVRLSEKEKMYSAENALDHIVLITNTGNVSGYIRVWFAFEMGDLTPEEFESAVLLHKNTTAWDWETVEYGTQIQGQRYAVVCAKYKDALAPGATTPPSLLQIMLYHTVTNETAQRLDGNRNGNYEIKVLSRGVSDSGAWGAVSHPWSD